MGSRAVEGDGAADDPSGTGGGAPIGRQPFGRAEANAWAMNGELRPAHMVTLVAEADATAMESLRERARTRGAVAPSYTALVVKAAALTMRRNPQANRAIIGPPLFRRLWQFRRCDICVAVEKGLPSLPGQPYVSPIRDPDTKSPEAITGELHELAACDEATHPGYRLYMRILRHVPRPISTFLVRLPTLVPRLWVEHRGCAAWVNAPSKAGADLVMTTWPWPISFSFGVVRKRPVVVDDDRVEARLTMPLVMIFDRRIMGGGPGSRLLAQFRQILEHADVELAGGAAEAGADAAPLTPKVDVDRIAA